MPLRSEDSDGPSKMHHLCKIFFNNLRLFIPFCSAGVVDVKMCSALHIRNVTEKRLQYFRKVPSSYTGIKCNKMKLVRPT